MRQFIKIFGLAALCFLTGCSDTIYGIPKSEWATLTPQEKQQVAASTSTSFGKNHKPPILKIFEKPTLTPQQEVQQEAVNRNNAEPTLAVPPK